MAPAGPLYSPRAVESALLMAAAALASKNAKLDELQERLECLSSLDAEGRPHATEEQREEEGTVGVQATAGDSSEQPAAELAAVRQRLAAAEGLLAAERSQRLAVKAQLAAVKQQLAEAVAAQGHAAAELGELEAAIHELRSENQQLRATLTQRESAYLTLLETVQQLFLEHSPGGSGGGSSPAKAVTAQAGTSAHLAGEQGEDVGARLQHKLWEWQQRLERAAHLRSAERADQQGSLVNCGASAGAAAPAGTAGSAGVFGSSQPAAPDSPASSGGSFVSASPLAGSLQAALEAAAASSVCTDDAVSANSSPSAATAGAAWLGGVSSSMAAAGVAAAAEADGSPSSSIAALTFATQPGSPRILAARPGAADGPAAAAVPAVAPTALAPGEAVAAAGTPNKGRIGGSRIKALGLKAALSPAQKPQQAAGQEA